MGRPFVLFRLVARVEISIGLETGNGEGALTNSATEKHDPSADLRGLRAMPPLAMIYLTRARCVLRRDTSLYNFFWPYHVREYLVL